MIENEDPRVNESEAEIRPFLREFNHFCRRQNKFTSMLTEEGRRIYNLASELYFYMGDSDERLGGLRSENPELVEVAIQHQRESYQIVRKYSKIK